MFETGSPVGDKLFSIHSDIVQYDSDKVKGPEALLVILDCDTVKPLKQR